MFFSEITHTSPPPPTHSKVKWLAPNMLRVLTRTSIHTGINFTILLSTIVKMHTHLCRLFINNTWSLITTLTPLCDIIQLFNLSEDVNRISHSSNSKFFVQIASRQKYSMKTKTPCDDVNLEQNSETYSQL